MDVGRVVGTHAREGLGGLDHPQNAKYPSQIKRRFFGSFIIK